MLFDTHDHIQPHSCYHGSRNRKGLRRVQILRQLEQTGHRKRFSHHVAQPDEKRSFPAGNFLHIIIGKRIAKLHLNPDSQQAPGQGHSEYARGAQGYQN